MWKAAGVTDPYRDTPAGELWDIVRDVRAGRPWREVVRRKYGQTQPWLCDIVTSESRDLFFRQHPPPKGARVMDIGSGWGQIALPLARAGHQVTAIEPTPERLAFIHAAAEQEGIQRNMFFLQADLFDLEMPTTYDLATCIGVLEWVPKFRPGPPREVQKAFLERIRVSLKRDGKLVLGIENRMGLKYLLGANDDHIGVPNIAVYDAELASAKWRIHGHELRSFTFSQSELANLLREAGFHTTEFFAAFPDYKLPKLVLPDGAAVNRFLAAGSHIPEHDGANGRSLEFQQELQSHYRTMAAMEIAHRFVPSFFVVATVADR
jgi:2-polyprenyl-3-methyl-5-hydroxy-6-metoxy-1,4-benzoquinol methylase